MNSTDKPYSDYTLDGCETLSIHNITKEEVIDFFNLQEDEVFKWEDASGKCMGNHVMLLPQNDWVTIVGPIRWFYESLPVEELDISSHYFINEAITLVTYLSSKFGRTIFAVNSNKFGVFEDCVAEGGNLISVYYHGDGGNLEELDFSDKFPLAEIPPPIDVGNYHFKEQILSGIQLYTFKET